MPNPFFCLLVLLVIFLLLLALCIFVQFSLLSKQSFNADQPKKEEKIYYVKKYKRRKARKKPSEDTIAIKGTLLSPDEFNKQN